MKVVPCISIHFNSSKFFAMKNLLNHHDLNELIDRLQTLTPENRRKWGKMSIQEVLPHMTDPLWVAIGQKTARIHKSIFYNSFLGKMIALYLPWPKGATTAPEFLPGTGGTAYTTFDQDRQALIDALQHFARHGMEQDYHPNPVFGKLSRKAWARLMWRHTDHHLRQFGA
ncbi:MAG: DUF1569 domain-containing protein [Bacteroidetes bacterium]|nr:MAG: DUF1569 domain-containing protein [Bacteroidota bacterium]